MEPCVKININTYNEVCGIIRNRRKYFTACYNKSDNYIFERFLECNEYHFVLCQYDMKCSRKNTCIFSHNGESINESVIKIPKYLYEQMVLIIIAIIKNNKNYSFLKKEIEIFKLFHDEISDTNHSDIFKTINTGVKIDCIYNLQNQMSKISNCNIVLPKEQYKIYEVSNTVDEIHHDNMRNSVNNISIRQPVLKQHIDGIKQTNYSDGIKQTNYSNYVQNETPTFNPPSNKTPTFNPPSNKTPTFNPPIPPQKSDTFRYINHNNKYAPPTTTVIPMAGVNNSRYVIPNKSVIPMTGINNNRYAILGSDIDNDTNSSPPKTTSSPPKTTSSPPKTTSSPPKTSVSSKTNSSPPKTNSSPPKTTSSPPKTSVSSKTNSSSPPKTSVSPKTTSSPPRIRFTNDGTSCL
jgi:hypothetical protein